MYAFAFVVVFVVDTRGISLHTINISSQSTHSQILLFPRPSPPATIASIPGDTSHSALLYIGFTPQWTAVPDLLYSLQTWVTGALHTLACESLFCMCKVVLLPGTYIHIDRR
jgi:hypothetical protein